MFDIIKINIISFESIFQIFNHRVPWSICKFLKIDIISNILQIQFQWVILECLP